MKTHLSIASARRHANRAAAGYQQAAEIEREIADRLLERLNLMKITPRSILDCGARTGYTTQKLQDHYPKAQVVGVDFAEQLLQARRKRWLKRQPPLLCADYAALPFRPRSFDVIFSHFALPWVEDLPTLFAQFYPLLKPNGLLLFTTVGPDTLKELRASCQSLHIPPLVHDFVDMHDIGDQLVQQRFLDPVMDMEYVQLRYATANGLFRELKNIGATNARSDRARGLYGTHRWHALLVDYQKNHRSACGKLNATVEVIYGHAWMAEIPAQTVNAKGEVFVPFEVKQKR